MHFIELVEIQFSSMIFSYVLPNAHFFFLVLIKLINI